MRVVSFGVPGCGMNSGYTLIMSLARLTGSNCRALIPHVSPVMVLAEVCGDRLVQIQKQGKGNGDE